MTEGWEEDEKPGKRLKGWEDDGKAGKGKRMKNLGRGWKG